MAKSTRSAKKRVNVKNLPAKAKTLTGKEMKKVKGGMQGDAHLTNAMVSGYVKPPKPLSTK